MKQLKEQQVCLELTPTNDDDETMAYLDITSSCSQPTPQRLIIVSRWDLFAHPPSKQTAWLTCCLPFGQPVLTDSGSAWLTDPPLTEPTNRVSRPPSGERALAIDCLIDSIDWLITDWLIDHCFVSNIDQCFVCIFKTKFKCCWRLHFHHWQLDIHYNSHNTE